MSDTIVMRHPTLPQHQEIEVLRDAMPHYTAAGWQLVPQAELDERAARAAAAAAEAAAADQGPAQQEPEPPEQAEQQPDEADAAAADTPDTSEPAEPKKGPARRAKAPQEEES
ncbi:hypothetical protein ACH41H_36495 [Streptomyces sp. NPDC020800]|uniref:hypothetical protein n=1 Tax=Streptomyces sp. NPDC020800 TaxID=3365092 RepID=UPI00379FF513